MGSVVSGEAGSTQGHHPFRHAPVLPSLIVILRGMDKIKTKFGVLRVPEDPVPTAQDDRTEDRWPFFDPQSGTKMPRKRSAPDAT